MSGSRGVIGEGTGPSTGSMFASQREALAGGAAPLLNAACPFPRLRAGLP